MNIGGDQVSWPELAITDQSTICPDHRQARGLRLYSPISLAQVENNTESTRRQYALVDKALRLGWPRAAVSVVDDELGLSGAETAGRSGFAHMATEVAMGRVGIEAYGRRAATV